jgi:predicted HNH restriction endonuclease
MTEKRRRQRYNRKMRLLSFAQQYKTKCQICGENRRECLDFHHLSGKTDTVGNLARFGKSYDRIKTEIDKCIVLCANCHRVMHSRSA